MQQSTRPQQEPSVVASALVEPQLAVLPMTLALAAALVVMALVQFFASGISWRGGELGSQPVDWALGAKVPSLVAHGEFWRLVTANFLHGNWIHLALNVVGLIVVGRMIEVFYGPARMLVLFVLSAVGGASCSYLFGASVSLGASTGIMGLVGALVWHNWKYREHLPERVNHVYPLLLALVAFQFAMDSVQQSVDSFGHLGGFFAGLLTATLLGSRILAEKQAEDEWLPLPTALATAVGLLVYGAIGMALAMPRQLDMLKAGNAPSELQRTVLLRQVIERRPYFVEARLELALQFLNRDLTDEARREYLAAVGDNPSLQDSSYGVEVREQIARTYRNDAMRLMRGNTPAALEAFRRAAELNDPRYSPDARNAYAYVAADTQNGDLEVAEQYAVLITQDDPDNPMYLDTLAWVYYRQGRLQKALSTQLYAVSEALENPGRLRDQDELPFFTPFRPDDIQAEMLYHLAAIYERLGKPAEAEQNYKLALQKRPAYPAAVSGLGRVTGRKGPRERTPPTPAPASTGTMTRRPTAVTMGLPIDC